MIQCMIGKMRKNIQGCNFSEDKIQHYKRRDKNSRMNPEQKGTQVHFEKQNDKIVFYRRRVSVGH